MENSQGDTFSIGKQSILWALGDSQNNPSVDRRFRFDPSKSKGMNERVDEKIHHDVGEIATYICINDWILISEPPFICRVLDIKKNIQSRTNKVREATFTGKQVNVQRSQNIGLFCQFYEIGHQGEVKLKSRTECLVSCEKYSGHLPDPVHPGPYYTSETANAINEHISGLQ